MPPTTLLLIRHGQTTDGTQVRTHGWTDLPLSDAGRAQAHRLADHLATRRLDALYCSDLDRSRETAAIVSEPHLLTPEVVPDLKEINFGEMEGCLVEEIPFRFPETFAAWRADPATCRFPNGENYIDVKGRVIPAVERLLARHPGETVGMVLHSGVNRVILGWSLGLDDTHIVRLDQDHACLNVIEFGDRTPILRLMNFAPWKYCAIP